MKIAFIHPDLGIGGAERLVVDAALALQQLGHDITIYTSHYDPSHCFSETQNLNVVTLGNTIVPTSVGNKFFIICSILRQLHLTTQLIRQKAQYDVFIVDQLSACVPFLRHYFPESRILFYCHFPDQLLAQRKSFLRKAYRLAFDKFEEWTTGLSDTIVVNSKFTRSVFLDTFPSLVSRSPEVVYPCVSLEDELGSTDSNKGNCDDQIPADYKPYMLSINRFERKKNIELAILSYALSVGEGDGGDSKEESQYRAKSLVIAGGYDLRVKENVEYLKFLRELCIKLGLATFLQFPSDKPLSTSEAASVGSSSSPVGTVIFLPSVGSARKDALLSNTELLLYTPTNEHFGIVPIEAMAKSTPVLATNTGGPLETVINGGTGWTIAPKPPLWAACISKLDNMTDQERQAMADAAKKQSQRFSRTQMGLHFQECLDKTVKIKRDEDGDGLASVLLWFKAAIVVMVVAIIVHFFR